MGLTRPVKFYPLLSSCLGSLETIILELEGGRYVGPIILGALGYLVAGRCVIGVGRNGGSGRVSGSNGGGKGDDRGRSGDKSGTSGGGARVQVHYDTHLPSLSQRDRDNLRTLMAGRSFLQSMTMFFVRTGTYMDCFWRTESAKLCTSLPADNLAAMAKMTAKYLFHKPYLIGFIASTEKNYLGGDVGGGYTSVDSPPEKRSGVGKTSSHRNALVKAGPGARHRKWAPCMGMLPRDYDINPRRDAAVCKGWLQHPPPPRASDAVRMFG